MLYRAVYMLSHLERHTRLKVRARCATLPNPSTQNTETHQQRTTPCRLCSPRSNTLLVLHATRSLPRKRQSPRARHPPPPTAPPRPRASPSRGRARRTLGPPANDTRPALPCPRQPHTHNCNTDTPRDAAASARISPRAHARLLPACPPVPLPPRHRARVAPRTATMRRPACKTPPPRTRGRGAHAHPLTARLTRPRA